MPKHAKSPSRGTSARPSPRRKRTGTATPSQARPQMPLPQLRSEDEERQFWAVHDSTGYIDWAAAEEATLPNLKPSTATISLRLPAGLLAALKVLANKQDVPYQSLLKVYLSERIARERQRGAA